MRKYLMLMAALLLMCTSSWAANIRAFTDLTGEGTGALDAIAESSLATNDLALVYDVSSNTMYFYKYDSTLNLTGGENPPFSVLPASGDGTGGWYLLDGFGFNRTSNPCVSFQDSNGTDDDVNGTICLDLSDTGSGTEDADITIQVQIAGTPTTVFNIDADGDIQLGTASMDAYIPGNIELGDTTANTLSASSGELSIEGSELSKSAGDTYTGTHNFGGATQEIPNSTSDTALANAGELNLNTTDEQLSFHSASDGEISGEAALSLLQHTVITFDPAWAYDQESTYRTLPVMYIGDDAPEGITITEWRLNYVGGDPTTELDADLMCDTTPDFNPAAGATVMDVLDTTAGASNADTGFDSATCANGSRMYVRFGADPTDDNVLVSLDVWFYYEED